MHDCLAGEIGVIYAVIPAPRGHPSRQLVCKDFRAEPRARGVYAGEQAALPHTSAELAAHERYSVRGRETVMQLVIVGVLHVEPDAERRDFPVEELDASASLGGCVLDGKRVGIPVNAPRNAELFNLRQELIRAAVDRFRETASDDDELW